MRRINPVPNTLVVSFILVTLSSSPTLPHAIRTNRSVAISPPVLKWQRGGCNGGGCETGWYASPAVADLDKDGQPEVIWAGYDLTALNGAGGQVKWQLNNPKRVWPGIAVADLTGDGTLEIVVGRNSNTLDVYSASGQLLWSRSPFFGGELRTLALADLENDGIIEIIVGRAASLSTKQLSVYEPDGTVRTGWPARRDGDAGYGSGMYNENVTVADYDKDGFKEIIGPTDTHYITALDRNGNQLPANAIYNNVGVPGPKVWSQVGVHVDQAVDVRGYANCGSEHRPNFANSAPISADLDSDGTLEIIVVGDVYDCAIGDNINGDLYLMPWILKIDRTRWSNSQFDWTVLPIPKPNSRPLSEDYSVLENNVINPAAADLDGDGIKEILYPSYDGRMHVYWLDKTEHGNWPYDIPGSGIRFAGEPVVADLDGDGKSEVIFSSWPEKGVTAVGQLHVLDYLGNPLAEIDLPPSFPSGSYNGGLGAPTLANIDADADLEIVVGTVKSGVVAYDLPDTANARVQWATGRANFMRNGTLAAASCFRLAVTAAPSNGGSVETTPPNCGNDYTAGSTVTVTATAALTNTFLGWNGATVGATNPLTLPMNGDKQLTAIFLTFIPSTALYMPVAQR